MTKLTDLACEVGSVQRDLFALRAQLQKDLLARLGKVLAREAMALSARTATLERQINTHLLQPSQKATGLRSTYERLTKEKSALSDSVSKLNSLLEIYTASEQQYLQLATQKADAQRQMAFIRQLQQTSPSLRRRSLRPRQGMDLDATTRVTRSKKGSEEGEERKEVKEEAETAELTQAEREQIEANRQKALALHRARVVTTDLIVKRGTKRQAALSQQTDSGGGFFIDPPSLSQSQEVVRFEKSEEESDVSDDDGVGCKRRRRKRRKAQVKSSQSSQAVICVNEEPVLPRAPDEEKPVCDECAREFEDSFLLRNFDCQVCDSCRDPNGIHSLITRSSAKERYLLSDVDIDVREPPLRRIFRKNPHNSTWGDMQLYLEAHVAARALAVWGSEAGLEAERANRSVKREKAKLRGFERKVKELRVQVRSSLYAKKSVTHEHTFGPENYDDKTDTYSKSCTSCDYTVTFEKM
ncbi:unnamed protein product [Mesocestoides corti]|uniref:XPA C-terminal domain-containing protein n=2 Tax=Mesocestoides corti TaxID=53468 RepID=A0A158QS11_MESCO|nr:unnamed protein product [Mesocestoides corti]